MHMVGGVLGREGDIYLVLVPASMHEGDVRPIPRLAVRGLYAPIPQKRLPRLAVRA